ncbi:MAG TPA: sugar-binding protein, partial [Candidatus Kapabacteria bacterium]|nr:sugar-binding protein [Candidatus Kapabacteria bacterium]
MMNYGKRLALMLFTITGLSLSARAQEGMTFDDFVPKLSEAFNHEMIEDIRLKLPDPKTYKIWGYDAGDYSGDGYPDCALSIQILGEGEQLVHVYFFVDDEGVLKNVATLTRHYITLPIEVGINIRDGVCSVVAKKQDREWEIVSYRYEYGDFAVADSFTRNFIDPVATERSRDFVTMHGINRFYNFDTDSNYDYSSFLEFPTYRRGHLPYFDTPVSACDSSINYVVNGSYYWSGANDCSFSTQTAYDDDYLYFLVRVKDDHVITYADDPDANDHIDIWIDAAQKNRIAMKGPGSSLVFRTRADSNLFDFTISLGNFLEKKPHIKLASSQQFSEDQYSAMRLMKVISRKTNEGYLIKVRIPFTVLGLDGAPVDNDIATMGCTVVVHDIDNGYRPEESTTLATSVFNPKDPTSYGEIILIPPGKRYGVENNIYLDDVLDRIGEAG